MRRLAMTAVLGAVALAACTPGSPTPLPEPSSPAPAPTSAAPSDDGGSTFVPSVPTAPAPTTAGELTVDNLPIPSGWATDVREGSLDEGFIGNGTWVHAREAQFSAIGVMTVGCADVDDTSWEAPEAALEGNLTREGQPGVVLALQFSSDEAAKQFFDGFVGQLEACESQGTVTRVDASPDTWLGRRDLGQQWSEVAGVEGPRLTTLIVSDGGAMTPDELRELRASMA